MTKKFIMLEAEARHILEQCGVEDAEHYTAGDVVGLANLLVERDSMRARIAELEAAQAWRPIESAPVARKVLVAYKNSLGNWRRVLATNYPPDALDSEESESGYADPGWYEESETHEELFPLEYKPVAWMPLPKGPEES